MSEPQQKPATTPNRSFLTTRPRCAPCPRCGRLQLTGHAEGLEYRADPVPLTVHGELAAQLAGRSTYAVVVSALAVRTATRITGDAHRPRPPVLATHRCEHPPELSCVDATHIEAVTRLVHRGRNTQPDTPAPLTDAESAALFDVSRELGGRVVAHDPHTGADAPF